MNPKWAKSSGAAQSRPRWVSPSAANPTIRRWIQTKPEGANTESPELGFSRIEVTQEPIPPPVVVPEIDVQAIVQRESEEAYIRGLQEGAERAHQDADLAVQKRMQELGRMLAELADSRQAVADEAQKELISLALRVVEEVLMTDAQAKEDFVKRMLKRALHAFGGEPVTVRVSPSSAEIIKVVLEEGVTKSGSPAKDRVVISTDEAMEPGAIIVEGTGGRFAASVFERFREAQRQLQGGAEVAS